MKKLDLNILVAQAQSEIPVMILQAQGDLDASTYLDLIIKSREVYNSGNKNLILDMRQITSVTNLSGLFALYSIALLFHGQEPPDPETGWSALHRIVDTLKGGLQQHFKLLKPQPRIGAMLTQAGLPVYYDLTTALASFRSKN